MRTVLTIGANLGHFEICFLQRRVSCCVLRQCTVLIHNKNGNKVS